MQEEVVAGPHSIELNKDIIKDDLPLWVFESFFLNNSSIVKKALPNHTLHLTSIPSGLIWTWNHFSHPTDPQRDVSKEELDSRVLLTKKRPGPSWEPPMIPTKNSPKSLLSRSNFHGVHNAHRKAPSPPRNSATLKHTCVQNHLERVKHRRLLA